MFLVAYDIPKNKRRFQIQKIAYSYAFGGQKSAVETLLSKKDILELSTILNDKIHKTYDKVNIIKVKKFLYLGCAKEIKFNKGDIIV